ncbi:MAG: EamA family transporter [Calditrichota bacterium]
MKLKNFLWLLFLAALWGPSYLFIKLAVQEIPPITLSAIRVGLATIVLYPFMRWFGNTLPRTKELWKHFAFIGLFNHAIPFALFSWGEIYVDSALASILNGTTPLFTIVLAHFLTDDDKLNNIKTTGTMIGFLGLVLIVGPAVFAGVRTTLLGLIAVTIPAACYGLSIVYTRRHLRGLPRLVAPTAQLLSGTLWLLPFSLLIDQPFSLPVPSFAAWGSLVALAIFGTAIAFIVYFHLIETVSATYISMVTYLVPIFGILLGIFVLNEEVGWNGFAGCALILLGVMVVNNVFGWKKQTLPSSD